MKMLSFDVGIKNMAYCLFDVSDNVLNNPKTAGLDIGFAIKQWDVINLIADVNNNVSRKCGCTLKNGKICNKKAYFQKDMSYYCKKHSTEDGHWLPSKEYNKTGLIKKTTDELLKLCRNSFLTPTKKTKQNYINTLMEFYKNKVLDPINTKVKKCDEYDLIDLGRKLKVACNLEFNTDEIDIVLIENQISPIANRMKTLQGMLSQYFIMKNDDIKIVFVSSQNKLKFFDKQIIKSMDTNVANNVDVGDEVDKNDNNSSKKYKENKKNGVFYCKHLLKNKYDSNKDWITKMDTKKNDDLADAFLQGIWYLEK
jgi:hypothetical protein